MPGVLFYNPLARQLSISGAILPGWTATFYLSETTTPAAIYEDGAMENAHTNPVEADADGHMPPIYLDPDVTYRVIIKDANGVTVPDGDIDPIDVSRGSGGGGSLPFTIIYGRCDEDGTLLAGSSGIDHVEGPQTHAVDGLYQFYFEDVFENPPVCSVTVNTNLGVNDKWTANISQIHEDYADVVVHNEAGDRGNKEVHFIAIGVLGDGGGGGGD